MRAASATFPTVARDLRGAVYVEFLLVFLPVFLYAVWPRVARWLTARGLAHRIPSLPSLTFIEGGVEAAPAPNPTAAPVPASSDERDPPLRSAG